MISNEGFRRVLPRDRLEDRAAKVIEGFEAMRRAREEERNQRIIDSPIDVGAVDAFKESLRDAWGTQRLVGAVLAAAGMYEVADGEPEEGTKFGIEPHSAPKGMFLRDPVFPAPTLLANDIGRNLAQSEPLPLVDAGLRSPEFVCADGQTLAECVRAALAAVRGQGDQLAVFVPLSWQLTQALDVDASRRRGGNVHAPAWVPEEAGRSAFVGVVDGVPVLDVVEMSDDRIVVVALDRFLRWRQWKVMEGQEVAVDLTAYNEAEARALVREHPDLFRDEERTTDDARARHLGTLVLLNVYERFRVDVVNPEAARWLAVPEEMRERPD